MADMLPRPDVEVTQTIRTANPTIIRPTLVPLVTGVMKEIVEVTTADGLVNDAAKQSEYQQLPKTISQTAFPSPRGNIAEVDVEESTIRAFLLINNALRELDRDPGSSFLWRQPNSDVVRPSIATKEFTTLALDGKTLILTVDVPAANTTKDVVVTFSGTGNLDPADVKSQVNTAMGAEIAALDDSGTDDRVRFASTLWGAGASITVRKGGTANTLLGFDNTLEYRVEGAGFRAQDQSDGRVVSSWIEWSRGAYLENGVAASFPTGSTNPKAAFVTIDGDLTEALLSARTFTGASSIDLKVGDEFFVDGKKPNGSAVVMKVESTRFRLGTVNVKLSTFDADGNVTSAVYDPSTVGTILSATALAPKYAWFKAKGLIVSKLSPEPATLTGSLLAAAARPAAVTSPSAPTISNTALAGLTLKFDITKDGVELDTKTFTFTGGPFANLAAVVSAFNDGDLDDLVASAVSSKLRFSTVKTDSNQAFTLRDDSTALEALGFVAATAYSATGVDAQFIKDRITSTAITFATTTLTGQALIVQTSDDYGDTWTDHTLTFAGEVASRTALLTELNGATAWDGDTAAAAGLVFAAGTVTDTITITSLLCGVQIRLKSTGNTALGAGKINGLTAGTEGSTINLVSGTTLRFTMNERPKIYEALFVSNSLPAAIALINEVVGSTIATATDDVQLTLTSLLAGYGSRMVVKRATSADQTAADGFGFGSSSTDVSDSGDGRPYPDFYVDDSGNAVIGAEIVRHQITGRPLDPGKSNLYLQYTGVRKDVSPLAKDPGVVRVSDPTTLSTDYGPINTKNPLGLGVFITMVNAINVEVAFVGADAISGTQPNGTAEAHARILEMIEAVEVYAIAPLTQDETIAGLYAAHVKAMSKPESKGERVVYINMPEPTRAANTLLASGLDGRTNGTDNQFVGDASPVEALSDAGLDADDLAVDDDVAVELTVGTTLKRYSCASISEDGHVFQLRTTFASGENEDGFYETDALTGTLVNVDWSIYIRGQKLLLPGSTQPDKLKIAETVAAKASAYKSRRVRYTFPGTVVVNVGGVDQKVMGCYACCATIGVLASQPAQQGQTNYPLAGLAGVGGTQFTNDQLSVMAAGGTYIYVQDVQGGPLLARQQVTTDMSSIETREASITTALDYSSKVIRRSLRVFLGVFNITEVFLDTLGVVANGVSEFLTKTTGTLAKLQITKLEQNQAAPDSIKVASVAKPNYPCNNIGWDIIV